MTYKHEREGLAKMETVMPEKRLRHCLGVGKGCP